MTGTHSILIAVAIVVLSFTLLTPMMAHPTETTVTLLNETVYLTEDEYEKQCTLTFSKGDQLGIKVFTTGQPVDLIITPAGSSSTSLLDEEGSGFYNIGWTVPEDGSYIFSLIAEAGSVDATMTITRK